MSEVIHQPEMFAIAQPYLAPADRVGCLIDDMKQPAYTWRKSLRHLYVLTWPFSLFTRMLIFVAVGLAWLVLGLGGFIAARLAYIWAGERSPWE